MTIPEALLGVIWNDHAQFLTDRLTLTDGTSIRILESGEANHHRGGPDFLDARIVMEGLIVRGDVELHHSPDDWNAHHHDRDARYSNVILHVVLEVDEELQTGPAIPTLALRDNLAFNRRDLWDALFHKVYRHSPELACFPHNLQVPIRFKQTVLERFGEARLDELVDRVLLHPVDIVTEERLLSRVYHLTMDALGYSQNRIPFRELSSLLPLELLRQIRQEFPHNPDRLEALYFGAAGLLPPPSREWDVETNEYILQLTSMWNAIQVSHPMSDLLVKSDWAFFRIRPANSPYRRLALAARLAERYFSRTDRGSWQLFFESGPEIELGENPFWEYRTSYGSVLDSPLTLLGDERRAALWLNVVLPARIALARSKPNGRMGSESEKELRNSWGTSHTASSAQYLKRIEQELLESESVRTVRSEQGALLLMRNFCDKGRCSECPIGYRLMEKGWNPIGIQKSTRE